MKNTIPFLVLIILISYCKPNEKYAVAIKDFPGKHQPHLVKIITGPPVGNYVEENFSKAELLKLTSSEHPVLRQNAFYVLRRRNDVNFLELLESHYDDTAIITIADGEYGDHNEMLIDKLLMMTDFTSKKQRDCIADILILEHSRLRVVSLALQYIDLKPGYYKIVKQMASRSDLEPETDGYNLTALARFKKEEDILFIRDKLLSRVHTLDWIDLELIHIYPHQEYLPVIGKYINQRLRFDLHTNGDNKFEKIVELTASYKCAESADLLEKILQLIERAGGWMTKDYYYKQIAAALWRNNCPAYASLLSETRQYGKHLKVPTEAPANNQVPETGETGPNWRWRLTSKGPFRY